ncbi:PREDICTED: uncharacterized protein LOC106747665 [Dinoponera quadriceps]|uniref:Uncharacterized protein LOC106747665 n=1 Tax=Dinoponera quadriceps TaxID=609295 RepID=A0A6P3XS59_DINQU|nr:PREDICTED: uncharacterized protein LOC106747665 [Dinoponera quadriceps]
MSNPNKQVFEYRGPRTAECYNQFFNPNMCHVCKSVDKGNLILCNKCRLISYCGEEHKAKHYTEHEEICIIIRRLSRVNLQKDKRRFSNWQQWIQSRAEFVESIQQKLKRPLEAYEKQMILWPKSCIMCYQQTELQTCQRCFSTNYCVAHAQAVTSKHNDDKCERLVRLLNIDIETVSGRTIDISYSFLISVNQRSYFEEMLEFCMNYVLMSRNDVDWLAKDYVLSDYLSGPLTIYFGTSRFELLNFILEKCTVIHVLAANSADRNGLPAWEVLLHLLPVITKLVIIMVGPELIYESNKQILCELCTDRNREFVFFSFPMLYCEFLQSPGNYREPNIVVVFHPDITEITQIELLEEIQGLLCPFFLSFSSEQKAQENIRMIQKSLNTGINPIFNGRNYFAGLAPHRDIDTGNTYFRNEHIIIYEDLGDSVK